MHDLVVALLLEARACRVRGARPAWVAVVDRRLDIAQVVKVVLVLAMPGDALADAAGRPEWTWLGRLRSENASEAGERRSSSAIAARRKMAG